MKASRFNYTEIVRELLESNADPNMKGKHSKTALMEASSQGYTEIVALLRKHGAVSTK